MSQALSRARLVTLWGPGGVGKSSLARQAAAEQRERGTLVYSLALRDVEPTLPALVSAVASELLVDHPKPTLVMVARALEARGPSLVVIDEGETALEPLGRVLSDLLARTAHTRFLVTSRSLVGLAEEDPCELRPFSLSDGSEGASAAADLFLARARTLAPDFQLDASALSAVLETTEGLPLAIELAAAHCATLPREAIDALVRNASHLPRSLASTIARSWKSLSEAEQRSLVHLASFSSAFSTKAALALLGDAHVESLAQLRKQSLVLVSEGEGSAAETRFRLLTSVRTFARLHADPAWWQAATHAHATYFADLALATTGEPGLVGELSVIADRSVADPELLPLATRAFEALVDMLAYDTRQVRDFIDKVAATYPMSPYTPRLWAARAIAEDTAGDMETGSRNIQQAIALVQTLEIETPPEVLLAQGIVAYGRAELEKAYTCLEALTAEPFPPRMRGRALATLSAVAYMRGDRGEAFRINEEACALHEASGDERARRRSRLRLAFWLLDEGLPEQALTVLAAFEGEDTPLWQRALASTYRGNTLRRLKRYDDARRAHDDAVRGFARVGSHRWQGTSLMDAGITDLAAGRDHEAAATLDRSIEFADVVGDAHLLALVCGYAAVAHARCGNLEHAKALLRTTEGNTGAEAARRSSEIHRAHVLYLDDESTSETLRTLLSAVDLRGPTATEHLRLAVTFAQQAIERREPPRDALVIERERIRLPSRGEEPEGAWVDLGRKPTLLKLVRGLARAHPGSLSMDALLQVGWPDERLQRAAAENRVRVALSSLRTLGLRDLLVHDKDGYRLPLDLRIVMRET